MLTCFLDRLTSTMYMNHKKQESTVLFAIIYVAIKML